MYVCMHVCIFYLCVCSIYVFPVYVMNVFLGVGSIHKVRVIMYDRGFSIHMGLCIIQIVIHKYMG